MAGSGWENLIEKWCRVGRFCTLRLIDVTGTTKQGLLVEGIEKCVTVCDED